MKKCTTLLIAVLLLTSNSVFAQQKTTISFKQMNLSEFGTYIHSIGGDTTYYFDLDNTLIKTNDYNYGSDGWSSLISERIKKDISDLKQSAAKSYLYDVLTPLNYSCLEIKAVKDQYPLVFNKKIASSKIYGLTSRSSTIASITEQNLKDAHYIKFPIIYTSGGDKGEAIYQKYLESVGRAKAENLIVYVDDSFEKIESACKTLELKFKEIKDVKIILVHLRNDEALKYVNVNTCPKSMENVTADKLASFNCKGTLPYTVEQSKIWYDAFYDSFTLVRIKCTCD